MFFLISNIQFVHISYFKMKKKYLIFAFIILSNIIYAQNNKKDYGQVHGSFELNTQTYTADSLIGAPEVPEKMLGNSYLNIVYTKDKFTAGVRYEAYLNTLLGYDVRYNGQGLAFRFATYTADELEVTAGNFYEQFGSGLILRAYEDKALGYDNAFDGIRIRYKPINGIKFTGIIAKQKKYFSIGQGIVRGFDSEFSINDIFKSLKTSKTKLSVAGSFVSKYEKSNDPLYNYPENVAAFSGRFNLSRSGFAISSEYAYKMNDPSSDNSLIFKDGTGLFTNASWSKKGIGILVGIMRLDNMSFRSERTASINDLNINYLPAIAKSHTYALAAMYPFSTQANGQTGINAEIFYKFKRKTLFGGKYGTMLNINFSQVNNLKTEKIIPDPNLYSYKSEFFSFGNQTYYTDYNIEVHKKINKKYKFSLIYMHQDYDINVIQGKTYENPIIKSEIGIIDMTYKISSKNALRAEFQGLFTEQHYGNWAMLMLEYTYSPHWFLAVYDQYNYGNPEEDHKIHYFNVSAGYVKAANRIQISYGKQREGIMCVGGVCRNVPASNGFTLSITSTF